MQSVIRVHFFDVSGKGGIAHHNFMLCRALAKQGVRVTLVTTRTTEMDCTRAGFSCVRILWQHHHLRSEIQKGVRYTLSLFLFAGYAWRHRPDIIHWHELKLYFPEYLLMRWFRASGVRLVCSAHDVVHQEKKEITPMLRRLYHAFDAIVVHTEHSKRMLTGPLVMDPRNLESIPVGEYSGCVPRFVPCAADARKSLNIASDRRTVLFFGYIRPYKGLAVLLEAFPSVRRAIPEAFLIVAGEPKEDVDPYLRMVRRRGISDAVRFHFGYVDMEQIPNFFSAADVVALPYKNIDQSGVVHLAFAYRKPVVATCVGGLSDVVQDGKSGFIVPPNDACALAAALVRALSNLPRLARMGRQGYRFSRENLSWEGIAEKTNRLYKRLAV